MGLTSVQKPVTFFFIFHLRCLARSCTLLFQYLLFSLFYITREFGRFLHRSRALNREPGLEFREKEKPLAGSSFYETPFIIVFMSDFYFHSFYLFNIHIGGPTKTAKGLL